MTRGAQRLAGGAAIAVAVGLLTLAHWRATDDPRLREPYLTPVRQVVVVTPRAVPDCGQSQLSLSPNGAYAVWWHRSDDRLPFVFRDRLSPWSAALIDVACVLRAGDFAPCRVVELKSVPAGFSSVYWASDERTLFIIDGESRLSSVVKTTVGWKSVGTRLLGRTLKSGDELAIRGATPAVSLDAEARRLDAALANVAAIREDPAREARNVRVSLDEHGVIGHVVQRSADLQLVVETDGRTVPFALPTVAVTAPELPTLVRDANGHVFVVGGGGLLPVTGRPETFPRPFTRPIHDARTGRLIGRLRDADPAIEWWPADRTREGMPIGDRTGGETIERIDLASNANTFTAVAHGPSGTVTYSIGRRDARSGAWRVVRHACDAMDAMRPFSISRLNAGTPARPLPARLYRRDGQRRLLVYLHGGPHATVGYNARLREIRPYLDAGFDVLAPDWSGTVGAHPSIGARLAVEGPAALQTDAAALADTLEHVRERYDSVDLLAVSFGGVLAAPLVGAVDPPFSRVALAAPLARLGSPSERNTGLPEAEPATAYQELYERALFGGDGRFAQWLIAQYAAWPAGVQAFAVFGELDRVSRPADLPAAVIEGRTLVIARGGHSDAVEGARARESILCWFGECASHP